MNFLLFDLRHNFLLSKSAFEFWKFQKSWNPLPLDFFLKNRLESTIHLQFFYSENFLLILTIFIVVLLSSIREILIGKKYKTEYFLILYFYLGYMLLTFANKGVILSHFIYLLVPVTSIWFASFLRGNYKLVFVPLLGLIVVLNFQHGVWYIKNLQTSFMEKDPDSWRSLTNVAENIIDKQENNPFGYFVFSPFGFIISR